MGSRLFYKTLYLRVLAPEMADFRTDLLAAGFSAILGQKEVVITDDTRGAGVRVTSIHDVFDMTYVPIPPPALETVQGELFKIHVKTLTGSEITLQVAESFTIADVKAMLEVKAGTPARQQRLIFCGKQLMDETTLKNAIVTPGSTIFQVLRLTGGGTAEIRLPKSELAPNFDYDFTNVLDDGTRYMRGKFEYRRPYGWYRYALKVLGNPNYGGDSWLGPGGIRTQSSAEEWPVSYHGTYMDSTKMIVKDGYKAGPRALFGKGVYTSSSLSMVKEYYAQTFECKGSKWKIALQNRVNPNSDHLKIIPAEKTGMGADYWVSTKHDPMNGVFDVRPYGVVICKV